MTTIYYKNRVIEGVEKPMPDHLNYKELVRNEWLWKGILAINAYRKDYNEWVSYIETLPESQKFPCPSPSPEWKDGQPLVEGIDYIKKYYVFNSERLAWLNCSRKGYEVTESAEDKKCIAVPINLQPIPEKKETEGRGKTADEKLITDIKDKLKEACDNFPSFGFDEEFVRGFNKAFQMSIFIVDSLHKEHLKKSIN